MMKFIDHGSMQFARGKSLTDREKRTIEKGSYNYFKAIKRAALWYTSYPYAHSDVK